ncbi:TetR family transcriptional regulator [Leucobacter sp. USCH14]|uniref:TetR/AcrR family transcriptional regulator n=1 Tax=Leucobacter sp. USCH14 TaxID=3024838 RepID=UPI0030A9EC67
MADEVSDRRSQIVNAAIDDIIELGLHRVTHRSIASRASVPPGSLTYYFGGLHEIFEAAFEHMYLSMSREYRVKLEQVASTDAAIDAVADLITGDYMDERQMRALFEMYSFGSFNATVRAYCHEWMTLSREALSLHFPERTAQALDALIEGWPMHRYFERRDLDRAYVRDVVQAVVRLS